MRPCIVRSYNLNVLEPLKKVSDLIVIGQSELNQDIVSIKIFNGDNLPWILITAGVHGDEPAGTFFLVHNFDLFTKYNQYNFIILPCINPDGFERNTRFNKKSIDLNRDFKKESESVEAKNVMKYIDSLKIKFDYSIDLHESGETEVIGNDPAPTNFYMWEINKNKETRVGSKIIESLYNNNIPTCNWETIFGDTNNNGVINYPEDCFSKEYQSAKSLDIFCNQFSESSITSETSVHDTIEYRMKTLRIMFESILIK